MTMLTLNILNFCEWWWIWWILPFILGYFLGRLIMNRWKTKSELLEKEHAYLKTRHSNLEKELLACRKKREGLEEDIPRLKSKLRQLESQVDFQNKRMDQLSEKNESIAQSLLGTSNIKEESNFRLSQEDPKASKLKTWGKLKSDNLQIIEGIGPKMNQLLVDNGITSWTILAQKTPSELRTLLDQYGDKYRIIDPSDWPQQSQFAENGDWEGLIDHQSADGSKSKARSILIKLKIINE